MKGVSDEHGVGRTFFSVPGLQRLRKDLEGGKK